MLRRATWVVVLCVVGCSDGDRGRSRVTQAVTSQPDRILVLFTDPGGELPGRTRAIAQRRDEILAALPPRSFVLTRAYLTLPGFAGIARPESLDALHSDPRVTSIEVDAPTQTLLAQSSALVHAVSARATHSVTGAGVTVAVLDTGVAAAHPDLASSIVAEQCFTQGNCQPGNVNSSANANDLDGHGTNVSGIITGDGVFTAPGIAPGAPIVAVRVIGPNGGYTNDWIAGLDWIYANNATLKVRVINMSIGTNVLYSGNCDPSQKMVAAAMANMRDAGVVVFASSGNDGANDQMRSPACNSGVISVGALYDTFGGRAPDLDAGTFRGLYGTSFGSCFDAVSSPSQLTCFTNAGSQLDLVAPGCWITAAFPPSTTDTFCGTSQASPTVAAIAALAIAKKPSLTPLAVEQLLKMTASPLYDSRTNRNYRSVDALAALDELAKRDCTGKANGTVCSDGNTCSTADTCQGGTCVGGAPMACPSNGCGASGVCDPTLGCLIQPAVDGTVCSDGNACTYDDKCLGGACKGTARLCLVATGCLMAGVCNPTTGNCNAQQAQPEGTTCFDGNPCTTNDHCAGGVCKGDPMVCPDTPCRLGGVCENATCSAGPAKPDQTVCGTDAICVAGACAKITTALPDVLGPVAPGGCSASSGGPLLLALLLGLRRRADRSSWSGPGGRPRGARRR